MAKVAITRALISVYDKTGLEISPGALHRAGVEIVSTGSTAAAISAAGVPVTKVEDLTGFPECLDGRVKTLHPSVHAGLLADTTRPEHRAQLDELGIAAFQLLVSNLYPFEQTVASGAGPEDCVEQIDIGGPAMVRAAAKNHAEVAVVTDPSMYPDVAEAAASGGFTLEQRRRMAARAYAHTAAYDAAVASWFASAYAPDETARDTGLPDVLGGFWTRESVLRYGENPHQRAALYLPGAPGDERSGPGIAGAEQLHGKEMSYNNYVDADAARRAAYDFARPCVAITKHSNPCGIAVGADLAEAHRKAHECDPASAFGGVIAANGVVTVALAAQIAEILTDVLVAPGYDPTRWRSSCGARTCGCCGCPPPGAPETEWRRVSGGMLVQTADPVSDRRRRRPAGSSSRARPPTRPPAGTWRLPGGRAGRSSPTRSCWRPVRPRSASAWAR